MQQYTHSSEFEFSLPEASLHQDRSSANTNHFLHEEYDLVLLQQVLQATDEQLQRHLLHLDDQHGPLLSALHFRIITASSTLLGGSRITPAPSN